MDNQDRPSLSLYNRLSEDSQRSAGVGSNATSGALAAAGSQAFVPTYVQDAVVKEFNADVAYNGKVKNKVVLLDNAPGDQTEAKERKKRRKRANKSKALTAKERRSLDVYNIPLESRKYELFLPLHELWKSYMEDLFGSTNPVAFTLKLLKADFHGAIITVVRSKCPTYVGASGIVAQETQNVFKIITPSNALQVIPKANNVFTVQIRQSVFTVHGNHFCFRASQRSNKKFKPKPTIDL